MRSTSSAIALALLAAFSGCAPVNVHSPQIRGVGYVRLDAVLKKHPLYGQLSQIDDAIAAINLASLGPHVPKSGAELAKATTELNKELQAAQQRANTILVQKQAQYARKEQAAVAAALAAAGQGNTGAKSGQQMSATSQQQAQNAAQQANSDFMAYQRSIIAQNNAAIANVSRQLQSQANQKYQAKVEQLQQEESTLSLNFTQQDSAQRLAIKTKLSNLAMDDATRKSLQSQLGALDRKEAMAALTKRNADQATLAAYRKQLQADTASAMRTQISQIQSQTRSTLLARRNEVTSQLRGLGPMALPSNLSPAVQAKIQQIHQQFVAEFRADAQSTIDEYTATKTDLDRQYAALHGADVGATGAAAKQLADLQKQRTDLYSKMVAQIQREATHIAQDRGLSIVFANVEAAAGGYDMTDEVTKDIQSLHE